MTDRAAPDQDIGQRLQDRVQAAVEAATPLRLVGGDTKAFYGRQPLGEPLNLAGHRGIVSYEPTELVITARAGTPLQRLEATLARQGQMLPFEPPHFGADATLGGTIACNLSGPRRRYAGAARDFVLGTRVLNGSGEILSFGGEVMKNVAGYDVSRLMTGAMGTLGLLLEISLKVLPRPETELTLGLDMSADLALERLSRWGLRPLPISASCHDGARLLVRLSGMAGLAGAPAPVLPRRHTALAAVPGPRCRAGGYPGRLAVRVGRGPALAEDRGPGSTSVGDGAALRRARHPVSQRRPARPGLPAPAGTADEGAQPAEAGVRPASHLQSRQDLSGALSKLLAGGSGEADPPQPLLSID